MLGMVYGGIYDKTAHFFDCNFESQRLSRVQSSDSHQVRPAAETTNYIHPRVTNFFSDCFMEPLSLRLGLFKYFPFDRLDRHALVNPFEALVGLLVLI